MINSIISNSRLRRFIIHVQFQWSRISSYGVFGIAWRLAKKILGFFLGVLLLPVSIILYFAGIRRLCIFSDRIGHLAIEPDTLLKAQQLGLIKPRRWFVLAPEHRIANKHMMQYWEQYFTVYRSTLSCFFLDCLSKWPFMRYEAAHFINNSNGIQFAYEVNRLWGSKPPVLSLTSEDKKFGDEQLALLGIPQDAWFVCIHAREGGFSPVDEVLHCHRNGRIENLIPAIEEITRRGGWVVRLGDPTMVPLKEMPQVIDYAHHALRSERLDIILCARARFILGNTSGIFIVGSVFGVPGALANMVPLPTLGFCNQDLAMPKLHWHAKEGRYLSFTEVLTSPVSTFRYASLYQKGNIVVEENTPEDILALTIEMLDRLDNKFVESDEDRQLHAHCMSFFEPRHYSYGAASKISATFLRQYRHLL